MLSAPLEPLGSGDGRLDRVGFNLRTEFAQSPSPAGKAQSGEGGGRRDWGASPRQESASEGHFPGSKRCQQETVKKLHFLDVLLLSLCPFQKRHILGCPGLGGGSVTLHLKQVWGYWSALTRGG